ncbi:hypothetical protein PVAND_011333 [Polypedilum vanderplanki]|uniref:Lipocalin/cytosolic fatty-acid binding domain-containing protein n=1 Tax=Polypedilum vanderplanki TaxID=319348 RepID=A0A9J6CI86_POLVA|nr:hypothetical protein PVAND_011333 [Polypedilum vanderplanki]
MERYLNKLYRIETTDEYFDEYLKGIGLNFFSRKLAKSFVSTSSISKLNDDYYAFTTTIPIKTHVQKFKINEEIEQDTMDGRRVKNLFRIEGECLIEKQIEDIRKVTIIREFRDTEMIAIIKVNDICTIVKSVLIE